ncbi:MAG: hypothetical protein M1837_006776 [Sclerophora amabilis]|nr:MAG: hypothetical protein M1837_006776 [Sclerophora amabilis]
MSSSHVVVIDSTARRATIKVTPTKHLSDVLQEACAKLGLNATQYGLKNNNKQVDLSRTIRLSGLSSGAKLELVLLSRSPSVVSVALQLPEAEAQNAANGRLVDKFPSTTTLWLILRKFESGVAGGGKYNFTARGTPQLKNGETGAGRLYYEAPVLQVMGRDLSGFTDLQKTLGQLGFNSGSTLLRLSFRRSETPLEEAMVEIGQYFKAVEEEESDGAGAHAGSAAKSESVPATETPSISDDVADMKSPPMTPALEDGSTPAKDEGILTENPSKPQQSPQDRQPSPEESTVTGPDQRPISIFAPPTSTTPQAANHAFNEADYIPTLSHAQSHQSRLSVSSRNVRLLSDAEVAAQQNASQSQASPSSTSVELKIRYPDQSTIVAPFTAQDTATTLYAFVRATLRDEINSEPFALHLPGGGGPSKTAISEIAADNAGKRRLIADFGLSGRVLVNFVWADGASERARSAENGGVLKTAFSSKAQQIKVPDVSASFPSAGTPNDKEEPTNDAEAKRKGDGTQRKGGMPKWLKLPGKK